MAKIHERITAERLIAAFEADGFGLGGTGFCLACGEEVEACEPDAGPITCPSCGAKRVYGAEQIAIMGF